MKNQIRHDGIVESVDERQVRVRIVQASSCAGCSVAAHCHAAEAKEKLVDVTADGRQWQVGQNVVVTTDRAVASKALLICFGLPLILMLVMLVVLKAVGSSEGTTALVMLGSLIPYYIIVWLMRGRIERKISFRLEETNE